jgi:uncharacterized small protein (DUF1192 family)
MRERWFLKIKPVVPMRDMHFQKIKHITNNLNSITMAKFNEKSLHSFPLAFYYSAIQAFDTRIGAVSTTLARFLEMRAEQHRLFLVFDEAYKQSLKSQSTKTIGDLDKVRDKIAFVIERVAKLWEEKLDFDDTLNIHGRRVAQAFKDFNFRAEEALVAENAKIRNIEQVFASADLTADLAAMGLTELNTRMAELTTQIEQLMSQRNEEQAVVIVGKLKAARSSVRDLKEDLTKLEVLLRGVGNISTIISVSDRFMLARQHLDVLATKLNV